MFSRNKIPEVFLGAMVPAELYDSVQREAAKLGSRKLKQAVIELLREALQARQAQQ